MKCTRTHALTLLGLLALLLIAAPLPAHALDITNATILDMRMPWLSSDTWRVINGYGGGECHKKASECGKDQLYAFDLVPIAGDAGGKEVFAPLRGKLLPFVDLGGGRGQGVKIETTYNGSTYIVHLYHLMNIQIPQSEVNQTIDAGRLIGQVLDQYPGTNHLHIQVTTPNDKSIPLKLGGRYYPDTGQPMQPSKTWPGQWHNQQLRNNVLYVDPNYGGNSQTGRLIFARSLPNLSDYGFNDRASSLRLNPGCTLKGFEHISYGGQNIELNGDTPNFATFGGDNMASSVHLACSLLTLTFEHKSRNGDNGGAEAEHERARFSGTNPPPFVADPHTGAEALKLSSSSARMFFLTDQNIRVNQGSISFWLKPTWKGDDGRNYAFFEAGDTRFNRFRIAKDAANNLRFIVWNATTEYGIGINVVSWQANQWYHIRVTWRGSQIELYIGGTRVAVRNDVSLPASFSSNVMYVGGSSPSQQGLFAEAIIDDFIVERN